MSHTWDDQARAVLAPGLRGPVRVLGGPGTGKSSLLIDAAVARIRAGVDPESVLLLTGSGRIGMRARNALTMALLRSGPTGSGRAAVREPLVRTVHSYAYAVLRRGPRSARARRPRGWSPAPNRTPSSGNCWPVTSKTDRARRPRGRPSCGPP